MSPLAEGLDSQGTARIQRLELLELDAVDPLEPGQAVGALGHLGGTADDESVRDRGQIGGVLEIVLIRGLLGDHEGVLILRVGCFESDQALRERLPELFRGLLRVRHVRLPLGQVAQKGAVVLWHERDLTALQRREEHVARTEVEPAFDLDTLVFDHVGVHVAQDQLLREVRRPYNETAPATTLLQRVLPATTTRRDHEQRDEPYRQHQTSLSKLHPRLLPVHTFANPSCLPTSSPSWPPRSPLAVRSRQRPSGGGRVPAL